MAGIYSAMTIKRFLARKLPLFIVVCMSVAESAIPALDLKLYIRDFQEVMHARTGRIKNTSGTCTH